MNIWAVKCRELGLEEPGWHWDEYFLGREPKRTRRRFGGPNWIKSNRSKKYLRDSVKGNDLLVCYQCDHREIIGFAQTASGGIEDPRGSGEYNRFNLKPEVSAFQFDPPLRLEEVRKERCFPKCFENGTQGTVFPMERDDFDQLIEVALTLRPEQALALIAWLKNIGINRAKSKGDTKTSSAERTRTGGGFGSNNAEAEQAAIRVVKRWYTSRGWWIAKDRQQRRGFGYDLVCTKNGTRRDIEVKGVTGSAPIFLITAGEVRQAHINARFRVCVVVQATGPKPRLTDLSGRGFLKTYQLDSVNYRAIPK